MRFGYLSSLMGTRKIADTYCVDLVWYNNCDKVDNFSEKIQEIYRDEHF